jgi:hypothetical protein
MIDRLLDEQPVLWSTAAAILDAEQLMENPRNTSQSGQVES